MAAETEKQKAGTPRRHQDRHTGVQGEMDPQPRSERAGYRGSGKLQDRVAIITGGDSGSGRSAAIYFAKEGADLAIVCLENHQDARETKRQVEEEGRRCLLIAGDLGDEAFCRQAVERTVGEYGRLDILVNNAAERHPQPGLEQISAEQWERTFRTNIFAYFYVAKATLPHLKPGAAIINTSSVTAYRGSRQSLDYSATKGAIIAFTRSLSQSLAEKGIRVNAVAPGPIWTLLIPSTLPPDQVERFGQDVPLGRPGQPEEVAPCFVFLASDDSSYMTGQVLHPNGGEIANA